MKLPKYITDERTGIEYELVGDYYLIAGDDDKPKYNLPIGKWGENARRLSQENKRHVFDSMLISGKLHSYLADIDEQAREVFDALVEQMKAKEGITEKLREDNQLEWVCRMQNIEVRAREIVSSELIYN